MTVVWQRYCLIPSPLELQLANRASALTMQSKAYTDEELLPENQIVSMDVDTEQALQALQASAPPDL